jgi:hypothetical protein
VEVVRVELGDLKPDPAAFLGQLGYLTLVLFENLGRATILAPSAGTKSRLGQVTAEVLAVHEGVLAELRNRRLEPDDAMQPYKAALDDYQRRTQGADWQEAVLTCYLTAGFLLDFFDGLADALPRPLAERVEELLEQGTGEELLLEELREAIDGNPRLASRLAMWGRRLVGDTMLIARSALVTGGAMPDAGRTEPVFTELIAAHTRRMDALGLTA